MKERLLKLIYLRYRSSFYRFFDEEFLHDIPQDVKEPAMAWLANGKEKIEKWALFMAKFLQNRMVTDPEKILTYQGMMLMLKLLMTHVNAHSGKREVSSIQTEEAVRKDPIEELKGALADFKKGPQV